MEVTAPQFKKYIFVCENERDSGVCCAPEGMKIRESLKKAVKERGLASKIRVSRTGCLDVCAKGPNVLIMPDNIWCKGVSPGDLDEIIRMATQDKDLT